MSLAISNDELVQLCTDYINRADSGSGSTLSQNRDQATDYYLGRITGRETADGLSGQISGDVADMTDAICSEIAVNLLSGDTIAELEPDGDEDMIPAQVETAATNTVIMEQNPGYEILSGGVQAGALYKTGIVAVEAQEIEIPRSRFVGNVAGDEKRILEGETGGTVDDDGNLTWTESVKRCVLRNVANENWFVDGEYPGWSLDTSNFAAERMYYSRGDLVDMGYSWDDVVKALSVANGILRDDTTRRYTQDNEQVRAQGTDEQELVETFWCYIRLPDSDHTLRLYRVHIADDTVLDKQPADFINYAVGKIIPMIGRHHGVSIHDRIKPIEDGRTYALRQWEDNLAYANNAELVLGASANQDDAQERIPGGYLRSDVVGDIAPLPTQDVGSNSKLYLDELRTLRSERGGSAMDMQRADSQLMRGANQIGSMGVGMIMGAAEQRTAWYARNIAETLFRQVFLLVHRTLRTYEMDPVGVWVMGQYTQVDTRQFREREAVNVRAGMSSSERVRRIQALDTSIQYQISVAQIAGPGVLSDMNTLHQALTDRDKAAGIDNPQRYWIDPQSPKSLEAQQANAQTQQQQQSVQMQLAEAEHKLKEAELQLDKYKHDGDLKFDYDELAAKQGIEEAKIVGAAALELGKESVRGQQSESTKESGGAADGGTGDE